MPIIRYSRYERIFSLIGDLLLINFSLFVGYAIKFNEFFSFSNYQLLILLLILNFAWWVIITYRSFTLNSRSSSTYNILLKHLTTELIYWVVIYLSIVIFRFYDLSRLMIAYAFIIQLILLFLWRLLYNKLLKVYRKAGYNYRNVIVLGTNENAIELYNELTAKDNYGYRFLGFFDRTVQIDRLHELPVYNVNDLEKFIHENNVHEVFCTFPDNYVVEIQHAIQLCENNLIRFKMVPDFIKFIRKKVTIDFINTIPLILLRTEPLESASARMLKRFFDIVFSLFIIVFILSWLFPIIALIITIESKGPVLFTQLRTGKNNRNFNIFKFRSMLVNNEANRLQAKKGDVRITRFGNFIRKRNFDELPQFFNVLTGKMSVVGPRPHMLQHTQEYTAIINKYMVRHFVKPGITGWAQIKGYRGETADPEKMQLRVKADVWYIENWTFTLDLYIIFMTIVNFFKGEDNAL